jgi:hypothetical protein
MRVSVDVEKCIQNSIDIIMAQQAAQEQAMGAAKQEADAMIMAQGGMPPEMGDGQSADEQGTNPPSTQPKEGNTAFTLNLREGDKGKK